MDCPICGNKLPVDTAVLSNTVLLYTAKDLLNITEMSPGVHAEFSGKLARYIEKSLGFMPFQKWFDDSFFRQLVELRKKIKYFWIRLSVKPIPDVEEFVGKDDFCFMCGRSFTPKAHQIKLLLPVTDFKDAGETLNTHRFADLVTPTILNAIKEFSRNHPINHRTPVDFNILIEEVNGLTNGSKGS
jgi:hypothetical protein